MPTEKNDLHRGTLDMLILKIVAAGPLHGYAIAQRLQQVSKQYFQVPQGSLYPALHRLEDQGLIASFWGTSENNRKAKYYRITTQGKRHMIQERSRWESLVQAVTRVLGPATE